MKWMKKAESPEFCVEGKGRIWQRSKREKSAIGRIRSPSGLWSIGKIQWRVLNVSYREGFNWNMMGRLNFKPDGMTPWLGDQQRSDPWKTKGWLQTCMEVTLRNQDGNFETPLLLPQCLWNRNSSATVMEPCLPFQTNWRNRCLQDLCWEHLRVTSMCVASCRQADDITAGYCCLSPGEAWEHAVRPLSHEGFRWALTKSFCRNLKPVLTLLWEADNSLLP